MANQSGVRFPPFAASEKGSLYLSGSGIKLPASIIPRDSHNDEAIFETSPPPQHPITKLPSVLIGVSTKAYFSHVQTIDYVQQLLSIPSLPDNVSVEVFFIPSFPGVSTASLLIQQRQAAYIEARSRLPSSSDYGHDGHIPTTRPFSFLLGAQDCHFAPAGAHTGSVTASELAELGCTIVELGHAERRRAPLCESNAMIASKAYMAVCAGLVPLICVGELTRYDHPEEALRDIQPMVESVLDVIGDETHVIFAYEPIWAIGQEDPAPAKYVCAVADKIRDLTGTRKGDVRILYGGSAKPGIYNDLRDHLDGLFLGRFAHDVRALREVLTEVGGKA